MSLLPKGHYMAVLSTETKYFQHVNNFQTLIQDLQPAGLKIKKFIH